MDADTASPNCDSSRDAYKYAPLTEQLLGLFYDVYNELGPGFLETVYREAFAIALSESGIAHDREVALPVHFRGRVLGVFKADFVISRAVIVEVKAAKTIQDAHEAQLLNYLRATSIEIGLLFNFGSTPSFKRMAFTNARKTICVHLR